MVAEGNAVFSRRRLITINATTMKTNVNSDKRNMMDENFKFMVLIIKKAVNSFKNQSK